MAASRHADACDTDKHLKELADMLRSATLGEQFVPADQVASWAARIEAMISPVEAPVLKRESISLSALGTNRQPDGRRYPNVADRGRMELRQASAPVPSKSLSSVAMCIYAVLQTAAAHIECETLTLYLPFRGSDNDFRVVCILSRTLGQVCTGSTILRGTTTMEYACMQTGYIINVACWTPFPLVNLTGARPDPGDKGAACARMCCPVKTESLLAPLGVVTAVGKHTVSFEKEHENFLFDAALMVGNLLQRCDDTAALQKCFALGDFHSSLPELDAPHVDIPSPALQLVYRTGVRDQHLGGSILVVGSKGVEKLREGSPLMSVFQHMEQVQKAWSSAVKLNIELKTALDESQKCKPAQSSRRGH